MNKSRLIKLAVLVVIGIPALIILSEFVEDAIKAVYTAYMPRPTSAPSSAIPDQICLTWSGDPKTTQAIQWRTSPAVSAGAVQFAPKADPVPPPTQLEATLLRTEDALVENDPVIHRFTAELTGLAPNTTYTYRVGNPAGEWSPWAEFTTAPENPESFSFLYFGDVQIGYDTWNNLLTQAAARHPKAAFHLIAGDLVNQGNQRNDWDGFFAGAADVYTRVPLVPCIGNHECPKGSIPQIYLDSLALPRNGPPNLPAERAFSLRYANALFIILDSNLEPEDQRPWLGEQLSTTDADWKFVMYHHPAYSSAPHRDNPDIREFWCDLFDTYHVDIAFQGHDHAYLRTPPMRAGAPVATAAEGTYYIIAVAGSKYYEQESHEYAAVAFPDTSTYQTIDITRTPTHRLTYRAYDAAGATRDEFTIEKAPPASAS